MYTVKFIDSESFDRLPYNKVSTSVGVADRNSGVAYVRDTGNPMDIFTAYHELEHLKGDDLSEYESPGEDGIYYKDFGQTMKMAAGPLAFVPGVGPLLSAGAGIGGSVMSNKYQQKQQKNAMGQMQNPMEQFQSYPATSQVAPAVSQVGGQSSGYQDSGSGGGRFSGIIRALLKQRQSGFFSGRDAGRVE